MSGPSAYESALSRWLANALDLRPPMRFDQLTGGNSNVTVRATDAEDRSVVLRRAPFAAQPGTYNLQREFEILQGLGRTDIPVPAALAFCTDQAVWDGDFFVSECVVGRNVRTVADANGLEQPKRACIGQSLVRTLALINATSALQMGLEHRVRPNYLSRQITRWSGQIMEAESPRAKRFLTLASRLEHRMPSRSATFLLHGDFRLDNCLLHDSGEVAAVLDWELAAFGDPLVDLALLCVYWNYPGMPNSEGVGLPPAPTALPGFPSVDEVVSIYERSSGHRLRQLEFYLAFAHWKIACVAEGVLWRYRRREMPPPSEDVAAVVEGQIERDLDAAATLVRSPAARQP